MACGLPVSTEGFGLTVEPRPLDVLRGDKTALAAAREGRIATFRVSPEFMTRLLIGHLTALVAGYRFRTWTLAICLTLGMANLPVTTTVGHEINDGWRRTVDGWEHTAAWYAESIQYKPPWPATRLHPMVVASLELAGALAVLMLTVNRTERRRAGLT